MADAMATALAAIGHREGERRGWNRPARLFTIHLADLDTRSIELRMVPGRLWGAQVRSPTEAITHTARYLPVVPPAVEHRSYADAPVAGIAAMFEGWGRPADRELTEYEQRSIAQGRRVNDLAPDRIESRLVYAWTSTRRSSTSDASAATSPRCSPPPSATRPRSAPGSSPLGPGRIAHALREGALSSDHSPARCSGPTTGAALPTGADRQTKPATELLNSMSAG
ncbi:hypothetical protein [Streptomyces sp. bgisy154]|uniref:hypothetical protein n=1 Tax=Streptomyces sp. bgisy154 TaxID=3413794 RepID=UPI003D741813